MEVWLFIKEKNINNHQELLKVFMLIKLLEKKLKENKVLKKINNRNIYTKNRN